MLAGVQGPEWGGAGPGRAPSTGAGGAGMAGLSSSSLRWVPGPLKVRTGWGGGWAACGPRAGGRRPCRGGGRVHTWTWGLRLLGAQVPDGVCGSLWKRSLQPRLVASGCLRERHSGSGAARALPRLCHLTEGVPCAQAPVGCGGPDGTGGCCWGTGGDRLRQAPLPGTAGGRRPGLRGRGTCALGQEAECVGRGEEPGGAAPSCDIPARGD